MIRVDPVRPDPATITHAGKVLTRGGVVIFPAQCLYGVGANALDPNAVEKVFQIKQRPEDNPILILVRSRTAVKELAAAVPRQAECLMDRFWPGRLTLVFEAAAHISQRLTAGTGKIGIRLPGHPVARALVDAVEFPLTGTSANLSGQPGCTSPALLPQSMTAGADLVLDAGPVEGGKGSTIVDVTQNPVGILREGAVAAREIFAALAAPAFVCPKSTT